MITIRMHFNFLIRLLILMSIIVYIITYITRVPAGLKGHVKDEEALPNIVDAHPPKGKSIFFHETSWFSNIYSKIFITSRQACAVESAAKLNPNFEIYLLYASPGRIRNEETESDRILQALLSYRNVKIYHLDYESYIKNTLVESLYNRGGKKKKSKYVLSHVSEILRYVTLWKYGGIYLDLDVVVIKSLENLPLNYVGAFSREMVAEGILSFEYEGIGHNLSTECLRDIQRNFNGTEWRYKGPGVITRLTRRVCGTKNVGEMMKKNCAGNFRVYPPETFYPIRWEKWKTFFASNSIGEVESATRDSYIVYTWSKLSSQTKLTVYSNTPYNNFAREFCPRVYAQCDFFF